MQPEGARPGTQRLRLSITAARPARQGNAGLVVSPRDGECYDGWEDRSWRNGESPVIPNLPDRVTRFAFNVSGEKRWNGHLEASLAVGSSIVPWRHWPSARAFRPGTLGRFL